MIPDIAFSFFLKLINIGISFDLLESVKLMG